MTNISFFSYKGGAGRTSLTCNTVPYLIHELKPTVENPIVVMDMDIDSKGLSYILDRKSAINTIQVLKNDINDEYDSTTPIYNHSFFSKLAPIGSYFGLREEDNGAVLFVSAHSNSRDNYINSANTNFDGAGIDLNNISSLCEDYGCKALIMDTPAGEQLSADAALKISDVIVTVLRITKQFRSGTYEFLQTRDLRYSNKKFIIVPNVVPLKEQIGNFSINSILSTMKTTLKEILSNNVLDLSMFEGRIGINEVELFKVNEEVLYRIEKANKRELTIDEKLALEKYELLAKAIIKYE